VDKAANRTIVLGLGNLLQSDDAGGARAAAQLAADPRCPAEVTVLDGGTLGLELLAHIRGAKRLLVLDAVEIGEAPGAIVRVAGEELRALPGGGSVHQLGVSDLLIALRLLGEEPEEVVLLGVQAAHIALGTELSPEVEQAIPRLLDAALEELRIWGWNAPAAHPTAIPVLST
jgi:hydrogenase maturation protease